MPRLSLDVLRLEERIQPSVDMNAMAMYKDLSQAQYSLAADPTGIVFVNEYKVNLVTDILAPFTSEFKSVNPYQPIVNFLETSVPGPLATILNDVGLPTTPAGFLHDVLKTPHPGLDLFLNGPVVRVVRLLGFKANNLVLAVQDGGIRGADYRPMDALVLLLTRFC